MRVESYRFYQKPDRKKYLRTVHRRLTAAQKERIHQAYLANEQAGRVATELGCSERIVRQYYQKHRGYTTKPKPGKHNPARYDPPPPVRRPKRPLVNESRFYRSDFIPR